MSATIFWRPENDARSTKIEQRRHELEEKLRKIERELAELPDVRMKVLSTATPSRFLTAMQDVFGEPPYVLGRNDRCQLGAMRAVWGGPIEDNPFAQLVDIIDQHEDVRLWAEY